MVVIDDKPEICREIAAKLEGPRHLDDPGISARVKVHQVPVSLIASDECTNPMSSQWGFSEGTMQVLRNASVRKPDLVIVDFFYADPTVGRAMKELADQRHLCKEDAETCVLTAVDLKCWVENLPSNDVGKRQILRNLFGVRCPVYLHSYTPKGYAILGGPIEDRRKQIAKLFESSVSIHATDTKRELFKDGAFDECDPSFYNSEYYPYQLATLYNQIVDKEILRSSLRKSRYFKIKRTSGTVLGVGLLGAGISLISGWAAGHIKVALGEGDLASAFRGAVYLLAFLIAGIIAPYLYTMIMQRLFESDDR